MKDIFALWMTYWLAIGVSASLAQPYEGRTLPPADLPDLKMLIERKRVELDNEEKMTVARLGFQLALAHYYVRHHKCPDVSHYHDFTTADEDRLTDMIIARYGK